MGVRALPVFVGEHFVGIVTSAELNALSEDDLAGTYVTAVMTREPDVPRIAAAAPFDTFKTKIDGLLKK